MTVIDRRALVSPDDLIEFVSSLLASQAQGEDGELMVLFANRLCTQAADLPVDNFNTIWIPFLRSLLPLIVAKDIPLDTAHYQNLYSSILSSYAYKYVGQEPAQDTNLARSGVACVCQDCISLNTFLASPTEKRGTFTIGKERRRHLEYKLYEKHIDCKHHTDSTGRTHSLIVTKTFEQNDAIRREWRARRYTANQQLSAFHQPHLKALLGQEQYEQVVEMKHLGAPRFMTLSQISPNRQAQPPRAGARPRQVSGMKRSHAQAEEEVIDLTSD